MFGCGPIDPGSSPGIPMNETFCCLLMQSQSSRLSVRTPNVAAHVVQHAIVLSNNQKSKTAWCLMSCECSGANHPVEVGSEYTTKERFCSFSVTVKSHQVMSLKVAGSNPSFCARCKSRL